MLNQSTWYDSVEALLERISEGRVVLPAFQRDYDWGPQDARALLATVLMGWPAGSLLLLRREAGLDEDKPSKLEVRKFDSGPEVARDYDAVVLDGQQRLTALYHALYDVGPYVYALSVAAALQAKDVEDFEDAIRSFRRETWDRSYRARPWEEEGGFIPFYSLRSAETFFDWQRQAESRLEPTGVDLGIRVDELYSGYLHNLRDYKFATTEIAAPASRADVARIFERVNRTGLALGAFDLAVARTYDPDWDLRDQWERARLEAPELDRFLGEDGMPALQIIALWESQDVRRAAVLSLPPRVIRVRWGEAIVRLTQTVAFLEQHCGVRQPDWLPYRAILVVLSACPTELTESPRSIETVRAWFLSRAFTLRFDAAVNTRIVEDWRGLSAALQGKPFRPPALDRDLLRDATSQGQRALGRAFLCALALNGSVDLSGEPLDDDAVRAPLFPRSAMPPETPTSLMLNQLLVARSTARLLARDEVFSPRALLERGAPTDRALASQFLPDAQTINRLTVDPNALFEMRLTNLLQFLVRHTGATIGTDESETISATKLETPGDEELRRSWLERLRTEYVLTHEDVSPDVAGGSELPPRAWLLARVAELGLDDLFKTYLEQPQG